MIHKNYTFGASGLNRFQAFRKSKDDENTVKKELDNDQKSVMDTLQSMVKFSDKKSPYGPLNVNDEALKKLNTKNVIESQINQFADMQEQRQFKIRQEMQLRMKQQLVLQSEMNLTNNSQLSDGQLFDEDHMLLLNDPTKDIHPQDLNRLFEEQKNQRYKNIYKQSDKGYLQEQKLKNVQKVLAAINQHGVINYNSVTLIDASDQVTNIDHMSQTSGLRRMLNLRIKNSWNGREMSKLSTDSLKDKTILNGLMDSCRNVSESEKNQMKSIGQTICKFGGDRSTKELNNLAQYLLQFKFFSHIKNNFSEDTFLRIISKMYIQKANKNCYLLDEGAIGSRYYVLLKGKMDEEQAVEVKLQGVTSDTPFEQVIWVYLQFLYDNLEKIYWPRVPYANGIKKYLTLVAKKTILLCRNQSATISKESSKFNTPRDRSIEKSIDISPDQSKVDLNHPVQTQSPQILSRDGNKSKQMTNIDQEMLENVDVMVHHSHQKAPIRRTNKSDLQDLNKQLLSQSLQTDDADFLETITENSIKTVRGLRKQVVKKSHVRISDELYDRLEKIHQVFDFTVCYLNTHVRCIPEQTSFVDYENLMKPNPYSIYVHGQSYLAYVDASEYNKVLKQATIVEMQKKLKILKLNKFFQALSSNKLQKLQYYAKRVRCQRDQVIYKENDEVDGIFLITSGAVRYSQHIQTQIPIDSQTKNKWFKDEIIQQGINKKMLQRDVAIFEKNEIIGFEELIGQFLAKEHLEQVKLDHKRKGDIFHISKAQAESVADKKRYFTCVGQSHDTELLWFSSESVHQIIRIHELSFIKKMFKDRSEMLNIAIDNLVTCKDEISGSKVSEQVQSINNKEFILEAYQKINPNFNKDKMKSQQKSRAGSPPQDSLDQANITFVETSNTPIPSMGQSNLQSLDLTQFKNIHIIKQSTTMTQQALSSGSIASQKGEKSVNNLQTESNLDTKMYANIGKNMESIKILESNDDEIESMNGVSIDEVHIKKAFLDKTGDFIAQDYRNQGIDKLKGQNTSQELTQYMLKSENSLKKYLKQEEGSEPENDYVQNTNINQVNILKQGTPNTSSVVNSILFKNEPMAMNHIMSQKGPMGILHKNYSKGNVLPNLTHRSKQSLSDFEDSAIKTMNYGVSGPKGWKVNKAYKRAKYGIDSRNSSYSNIRNPNISYVLNTPQINKKPFVTGNTSISRANQATLSARPQNSPQNKNEALLNSVDSTTGIGQMVSHKSSFYASKTYIQSPKDLLSMQVNTPTGNKSQRNISANQQIKYQDQSSFMDQSQEEIREICTVKGRDYEQEINTADITEYQKSMLNKDSSSLYLKDTRTFLGLKKVAQDNAKRKELLDDIERAKRGEFSVENSDGHKIVYQDNSGEDQENKIIQRDAQLNLRLLNVFQKLDVGGFLKVDENGVPETFEEQSQRFKIEREKNMAKNEELFLQLEKLENKNKKRRMASKKRKGFQSGAMTNTSAIRDSLNESVKGKIEQRQAFLSAQLSDSPIRFQKNRVLKGSVVRDSKANKTHQNLALEVNLDTNLNLIEVIHRQNQFLVKIIGQDLFSEIDKSAELQKLRQPQRQMELLQKIINSMAEDSKSVKAKRDSLKINKQLIGGSIKNIKIQDPQSGSNESQKHKSPKRNSDVGTESMVSPHPTFNSEISNLHEDDYLIKQNEIQLEDQKWKLSLLFEMQKEISDLQTRYGTTVNVSQQDFNRQSSIQKSFTKYMAIEQHQHVIPLGNHQNLNQMSPNQQSAVNKDESHTQSFQKSPRSFKHNESFDQSRQRAKGLQDKFKSQKPIQGEKKLITVPQQLNVQSPTKSINTIKNTKRNSANSPPIEDQSGISFKDQKIGIDSEVSPIKKDSSVSDIIGEAGKYTSVSIPQVENDTKFHEKVQITFDDTQQRDNSKISKEILINMSQVQMNEKYNKSPHLNFGSNFTILNEKSNQEEPYLLIASNQSIHTSDSEEEPISKRVVMEANQNLDFQTNARNSKELSSWTQNQKILQQNKNKISLKRSKVEQESMARYMGLQRNQPQNQQSQEQTTQDLNIDLGNVSKDRLLIIGKNKKELKNSQIVDQISANQMRRGVVKTGRAIYAQSGPKKHVKFGTSENTLQVKPIEALRQMTQSFDGLSSFNKYKPEGDETAQLIMKGQLNRAYILNQKNVRSLAHPSDELKKNFKQHQLSQQNMQLRESYQRNLAQGYLKLSPGIVKLKDKFSGNKQQLPSLTSTFNGKINEFKKFEQQISQQISPKKSVPFSQRQLKYIGHQNAAIDHIPFIVTNRKFEIIGTSSQRSISVNQDGSQNQDNIFQFAKGSQNTIATGQDEENENENHSTTKTPLEKVTPFTRLADQSPLTQLNTRSHQVSPEQQ